MPVRFLSDAQREQLSGFPAELDGEALDRFFTLSDADLAEVRRRHGDSNRLGWALQLCGMRMLGFCPDDLTTAPVVVIRLLGPGRGRCHVRPLHLRATLTNERIAELRSVLDAPRAVRRPAACAAPSQPADGYHSQPAFRDNHGGSSRVLSGARYVPK